MTETEQDCRPELLCTTCGLRPRQPGQRKCRECHAEYMRDWRLKQTTIRLEDANYEYLRRLSFDTRRSMSRLINEAIEKQRRADVSRETKDHR